MSSSPGIELGKLGETYAAAYLEQRGYRIVEHGVTFEQEEQMRSAADRSRLLRRTGDLRSGARVGELERIGPDDGWQSCSGFVIRWQVKRERALHAVCT